MVRSKVIPIGRPAIETIKPRVASTVLIDMSTSLASTSSTMRAHIPGDSWVSEPIGFTVLKQKRHTRL